MLSPQDRQRIEAEELYRAEVRRKANQARPLRRALQWVTGLATVGVMLVGWAATGEPMLGLAMGAAPGILFGMTLVTRLA